MQKYPGVLYRTGGRRIRIRARIGLRSGKTGNRGTYRARIGDGVNCESDRGYPTVAKVVRVGIV